MKKKIIMLPCIAAIAIATVVGKKTFESHANETSSLLMQNVEALSQGGDNPPDGYVWVDSKQTYDCTYKLTLNGEGKIKISIGNHGSLVTLSGDANATITYTIPSARVDCYGSEKKNVLCMPKECPTYSIISQ